MDDYQEAITFAQAGEYEPVDRLHTPQKQESADANKLLVIGSGSSFSPDLVSYSLEMACRLSYEILAMNVSPVPAEKKESFRLDSEKSGEAFRKAAGKEGVEIRHIVKFTTEDQALEEVMKEEGTIDFVVSDTEAENRADQRDAKESRPVKECYVYSMG